MTKSLTISVRTHFKLEDIANILYSIATGSRYWCSNSSEMGYERNVNKVLYGSLDWFAVDAEEDEYTMVALNLTKIKKGLTLMAKKEPSHFADILNENTDEVTADILLQLALFGEVKYS